MKSSSDGPSGPISDNLSEDQLNERLVAIQNKIDDNPNNPSLYYQKGVLLTKWTQKKEQPSQRTSFYAEADEALSTADSLFKHQQPPKTDKDFQTNQLRRIAWSNEHNQGIQDLQNAKTRDDYLQSAIHFKNATAIMPDSITSYQMAGQAYYKSEVPERAIQILENARQRIDPLSAKLLESLAYLYLETEQPKKAVPVFEKARTLNQRNFNTMHGLSNAYIQAGEYHKAITLLQQLTDRQPDNTTYRIALATQFYEAGHQKLTTLLNDLEQQHNFQKQTFSVADSLFNQAEEQYNSVLKERQQDNDLTSRVAQFYQNRAAQYQKLLPFLSRSEKNELETIIERSISASIPLLRKLTEQNPSKQIWQNLYQAYSYLGLQEEAEKAKANI